MIQDGDRTAIRRRPEKGLLAGLYELPNVEGTLTLEEVLEKVKELKLEPLFIKELETSKHIFSHIEWRMTGYLIRVASLEQKKDTGLLFVERNEREQQYAIPSAFRAYAKYIKQETKGKRRRL